MLCIGATLPAVTSAAAQSTEPAVDAVEPSSPSSPSSHPYAGYVAEAAQRFGVPPAWIWAVMRVESNGDAAALSTAGAMGLMQIMPRTYADLRVRHGLGPDPWAPRDNIIAGAAYLREMFDRYGSPGFLAAYNAGPGRYEDYLAGRALPLETRTYLARLSPQIGAGDVPGAIDMTPAPDPLAWTRAALFVRVGPRTDLSSAAAGSAVAPPSLEQPARDEGPIRSPAGALFVALSGERR